VTRHEVVLVRHGETEWSRTGQHTGRTDIDLTDEGRAQAKQLAAALVLRKFALVLTSPRTRALDTCRLAGFGDRCEVDDDLAEWDYGEYEGRTTAAIHEARADWSLWRDGAPGGEHAADVAARADRVLARVRAVDGDTLVFSHGHFLRVLGARWVALDAADGGRFALDPASVSVLGWERDTPVFERWNA
jgi:broad specificity phosphatase PhoE